MADTVSIEALGAAIEQELTLYHQDVVDGLDRVTQQTMKDLVKQTRATAPVGYRGKFKRDITYQVKKRSSRGCLYVWGAKAPSHRLTHLVVKGHATRDGGRTRGNSFLQDALDKLLPQYERNVEEVLRNGR